MPSYPGIIENYSCGAPNGSRTGDTGCFERVIFRGELFGEFWQLHVNLKGNISFANLAFGSPGSSSGNKKVPESAIHYSSECSCFVVQLLSFQLISLAFDE